MDRKSLRKMIQQEIAKVKEDYLVPREEVPPDFARVISPYSDEEEPESTCDDLPAFEPPPSKKLSCATCGGVLVMEGGCGCPSPDTGVAHPLMSVMKIDSSEHHKEGAYMAKAQLHKIKKYSEQLQAMIPEGHDLEDWMRTKISQAADDLGEVFHKLEYKSHSD